MEISLETLGIDQEELTNRLVDRLCDRLVSVIGVDEDGDEWCQESPIGERLRKETQRIVDEKVAALANEHVLPKIHEYVDNICLQETNKWGEAKGEKLTFIEYLTRKAEAYLVEDVDYQGKTKNESGSYTWKAHTTRIASLVHKHLQFSIERAMKEAVGAANSQIAGGIQQAVGLALQEICAKIKVDVKTK